MAATDRPANVTLLDHPLVAHKLALLRDEATGPKLFRELVRELSTILAVEATRDLALATGSVKTPVAQAPAQRLAGEKLAVVPILRAGLGMVDGVLQLVPTARVGHLGMYRDHETLTPVEYYANLPDHLDRRDVLLVDPMLATGGSAIVAIEYLRRQGAGRVKLLVLIAAPEGISAIANAFGDSVQVFACAIDERLNELGYIVPGLGDAGDRLFGTM
jgi:uracil phosphoribosyltransferase